MKRDLKRLYFDLIEERKYDKEIIEAKFVKLDFDKSKFNFFQLKSAIVYLSRFEDEIDEIIEKANNDALSILNAATVKQERS
ncbi:MAG: hypothetical protein AAFQ94_04180 [Bacteroidota bacterium]